MNLFDYLAWRGDLSFDVSPCNKVDCLLFSHIIYMHFHDLISADFNKPITLKQLAENLKNAPDFEARTNLGAGINPKTVDLFFKCAETKRYGNMLVGGFRCVFDEVKCEQFAAATFYEGNNAYIAYRGTDDTIIGWKEDFLLAYMDPFPSQSDGLLYFNDAVDANPEKNFTLAGHSKGGNLALYAAVNSKEKYQNKIAKIYNLDGPGFVQEFFEKPEFKAIESKLENVYPEDDYVGMLQKHSKNFQIIKSDEKGISQHDPLNWNVIGSDFVKGEKFTDASQVFYRAINDWSLSMTNAEKEKFVTALFDIYLASGCKTNAELGQNLLPASKKIIKAYNDMEKETKKEVKRLINLLGKCVKSELPIFNMFSKIPLEPKAADSKLITDENDGGKTESDLDKSQKAKKGSTKNQVKDSVKNSIEEMKKSAEKTVVESVVKAKEAVKAFEKKLGSK